MLAEELREYYGNWVKMSRALDLGNCTYLGWLKKGYIPFSTQCIIEKKTKSRFKADKDHCKKL